MVPMLYQGTGQQVLMPKLDFDFFVGKVLLPSKYGHKSIEKAKKNQQY